MYANDLPEASLDSVVAWIEPMIKDPQSQVQRPKLYENSGPLILHFPQSAYKY